MASMVARSRRWHLVFPKWTRPTRQRAALDTLSLEQTAQLAPDWGRVEVRRAHGPQPGGVVPTFAIRSCCGSVARN